MYIYTLFKPCILHHLIRNYLLYYIFRQYKNRDWLTDQSSARINNCLYNYTTFIWSNQQGFTMIPLNWALPPTISTPTSLVKPNKIFSLRRGTEAQLKLGPVNIIVIFLWLPFHSYLFYHEFSSKHLWVSSACLQSVTARLHIAYHMLLYNI